MTADPRIEAAARAQARLDGYTDEAFNACTKDHQDEWLSDARAMLAAADAVDPARAELGRALSALADLVEASDEASDFTSGEAVSAFNAALGAARGVLGDPE